MPCFTVCLQIRNNFFVRKTHYLIKRGSVAMRFGIFKKTAVILAAVMLTACVDTPKNVKNKNSSQTESDSDLYTHGSITYADDLMIKKPDTDEYYTFTLNSIKIPSSDSLELFNGLCDKLCKDKFDSKELDEKRRFISPDIERKEENEYPFNYPKISEYLTQLRENKIKVDEYFIDDKELYLSVINKNIHAINKGGSRKYLMDKGVIEKNDKPIAIFFPDWYCKVTKEYSDKSDDKITLSGKELTISDAEAKAIGYIKELNGNSEIVPIISQARVLDMNGQSGLSLCVSSEYKGVPFDANEMKSVGMIHSSGYSNGKSYENMPATAFMYTPDDLDILVGYYNSFDITNAKKIDLKISTYDATKIVDEQFTDKLKMSVRRIELVYCRQIINDGTDGDIVYDCCPVWKLSAVATNSNTDLCIYVNAVDGECYYYENK